MFILMWTSFHGIRMKDRRHRLKTELALSFVDRSSYRSAIQRVSFRDDAIRSDTDANTSRFVSRTNIHRTSASHMFYERIARSRLSACLERMEWLIRVYMCVGGCDVWIIVINIIVLLHVNWNMWLCRREGEKGDEMIRDSTDRVGRLVHCTPKYGVKWCIRSFIATLVFVDTKVDMCLPVGENRLSVDQVVFVLI